MATDMSTSRPIAAESTRLLRAAKSAKARGYSQAVQDSLVMAGYQAKENEPRGIQSQQDIFAQQDLVASQGFAKAQAAKQAADENLKGRISFADELKQRAGGSQPEGFDLRSFAEPRAAQLGISQGALTSFFQKNNLPMTNVAATNQAADERPKGTTYFAAELDELKKLGSQLGSVGFRPPASFPQKPSSQGDFTNFSQKNNLPMTNVAATTTPSGGTKSLGNSGVPGSSAVPLKSQAEIESEKKKKATPNYGGTYGSSGYYQ
jgi:hypothetical protein